MLVRTPTAADGTTEIASRELRAITGTVRRRALPHIAALITAVITALLAVAACGGDSVGAASSRPTTGGDRSLDLRLPASLAHAQFVTAAGKRLSFAALRGRVVVVSDMLTFCQGTCPVDTADLVATARRVNAAGLGDRVAFLSLTVDPERDSPRRLAAFRRQYRPAPADWQPVTGAPRVVNALWNHLGVYRRRVPNGRAYLDPSSGRRLRYDITHSDELFLFDTAGRERFVLEGVPHVSPGIRVPAGLLRFEQRVMAPAGPSAQDSAQRTQGLPTQSWTEGQAAALIARLLGRQRL